MSKQTEALKLALEALEELQGGCTDHNDGTVEAITVWCPEVITAIREALAEQPAQPQQEPVAWMHTMIDDVVIGHRPADIDRHPERWTPLYKKASPCPTCEALARTVMLDQTSHDTSPPAQRTWVGLTRRERFEIEKAMSKYYDYQHECKTVCLPEFAAAIEAKLKEKNT